MSGRSAHRRCTPDRLRQPAILRYEPGSGVLETWFDAAHGLVEPVAMAVVGDRLWLADAGSEGPDSRPPDWRSATSTGERALCCLHHQTSECKAPDDGCGVFHADRCLECPAYGQQFTVG